MARKADVEGLMRTLNRIPQSVRKAIMPAIDKGADEMVARMKYLAPDDPKTSGGDLKSNIRKVRSDVPLAVRVQAIDIGPDGFDNALAQEYGVLHMPGQTRGKNANPFFWPTVDTTKKRVRSRIDRAIGKAIREEWDK